MGRRLQILHQRRDGARGVRLGAPPEGEAEPGQGKPGQPQGQKLGRRISRRGLEHYLIAGDSLGITETGNLKSSFPRSAVQSQSG